MDELPIRPPGSGRTGTGYIPIELQGQMDAFASRHSIRGSAASHLVDVMLLVELLLRAMELSGRSIIRDAAGCHVGCLLWGESGQWQNLLVEMWTRSSYCRGGKSFLKQQEIGWILQPHVLNELTSGLFNSKAASRHHIQHADNLHLLFGWGF